jgi:Na+/H+-dicarboxylate symporter
VTQYTPPPPPGGYAPPPGGPVGYGAPQPSQGLAIASMVCGIASIVLFCVWWLSIPLAIAAVICGILARGKIARGEAAGAGMAKAGLITGIIGAVLAILFVILAIVGFTMFGDQIQKEMEKQQRLQDQQQQSTTP